MEKKKDGSDFVWSLFVIVLIVFIYVSICTGFGVELTKIFIYSLFSIFAIMCFIVFVFEFYLGINEFFIRIKDVFLWSSIIQFSEKSVLAKKKIEFSIPNF